MNNRFADEVTSFLQRANIEFEIEYSPCGVSYKITDTDTVIELVSLEQAKICRNTGLSDNSTDRLFLFEDRWNFAKEQMEQRILNRLGAGKRIFARNCQVISILPQYSGQCQKSYQSRIVKFIDKYHSLKYIRSPYILALENKENIVAAATFSKPIITNRLTDSLPQPQQFLSFEWTRYTSLPDITVVGGMGKILNAFIEKLRETKQSLPIEIMSYSDNEWGNGNAYKKLGFKEIEGLKPTPHFVNPKTWERYSSHNSEKYLSKELIKIYNLGSRKWLLTLK